MGAVGLCALALAGCENVDLERMIDQPSYRAYERSDLFADGMVMRRPPDGTVPRSAALGDPSLIEGVAGGDWVTSIPVDIDRAALVHARRRFHIYCATCHGPSGDGRSPVADNMALRPPPSLVTPPVSQYPPGRIFAAATRGYGLMPAYRAQLSVEERWGVVAYLEVLRLQRGVALEELPAAAREEASRWLP